MIEHFGGKIAREKMTKPTILGIGPAGVAYRRVKKLLDDVPAYSGIVTTVL